MTREERQRILDKAEGAAAVWCSQNGHTRRTLAGLAGHPNAIVQRYGTLYLSYRVARAVLRWIDDDRRQLRLFDDRTFGQPPHGHT